jgi:RND family efflux transporter MFP subunit
MNVETVPFGVSVMRVAASLFVLTVLLGLVACDMEAESEGPRPMATRTVTVSPVSRGDLVETVSLVGELQGVEEVRIFALVTDRIRQVAVREGDRVRANEVLATVDAELASQSEAQAEAALEAAIAARDALADEIRRMRPLVEGGSAPRSQIEALEAQLRSAEAQVRQARAGAGQATAQRGRTVIRSPIAGVVTALNVQAGEIPPPQAPLLTVVQPDRLKVVLRAPERHFLRIGEGMPVRISPLADPAAVVEATVSLKGPVVDRMTRTGLVEVRVDNADGALLPGTAVRAIVEIGRQPDVVLIPSEAALLTSETERTGRAMVFVRDGEVARRRDVIIGTRQADRVEVREGLSEGEEVVVRGVHFLRDGNPIRIGEGGESAP